MNRTTILLSGVLLALTPVAFTQQSAPSTPEDAYSSRELIAWSQLQKPQPAPQPLPPRDTPIPQPEQPADQQSKPPADPQNQQEPAAQSFTGKILKDSGKYVLKAGSSTTYQLEGQGDFQQFENQNVKIIGNLDKNTNTIRVVKIELLS